MNENQENSVESEEKLTEEEANKAAEEIVEAIKQLPATEQEQLAKKIEGAVQPQKGIEAIKWFFQNAKPKVNLAQVSRKNRGVGITRKNKSKSKNAQKIAKNSRKINRGK